MNSADRYKDSEGSFSHLYARQCFQACSVLSNCCAWNPLVFSWKRSFGKALGIFALLCVKLWWQTKRELRKHVCIDFCLRSCLNCLYENVSILLPLIHKLRGVYIALQTRLQQIFSVLKHSRFGWHLRKLSVFVFKCKANAKKQPPWQMTTCPEAHSNPPRHLGFYFSLHTVLCYQTGRLTDFHFWQKTNWLNMHPCQGTYSKQSLWGPWFPCQAPVGFCLYGFCEPPLQLLMSLQFRFMTLTVYFTG